jgi:type I restriction enzyme R subunit
VDIREAFNQIDRYQRDSFWAGSGLFEYVQLFVISNGTLTKYYSNTVRAGPSAEQGRGGARRGPEELQQLRLHQLVGRRAATSRSLT